MDALHHVNRDLPIVVVSAHEGLFLTETFSEDLARQLCGLAVIAKIDDIVSWHLTKTLGREWSCFNGAVRVYWPIKTRSPGDPYHHPLWTRDRLIEAAGTPKAAAQRIVVQLRRLLVEVSTYTFDEPAEFVLTREAAARARFEQSVTDARAAGDHEALAEQLFNEAARLERANAEQSELISELQAKNAALLQAMQYARGGQAGDIEPEAAVELDTISEAVSLARSKLASELVFGDDVDVGVAEMADDAGPP